ncbi:hypothetical protein C808_04524 [Lachnospiraceae bacterium M18-1]|nr:hypothetical protein C808_04524 [Lachnospiraceae bacterium M18-1]
MNSDEIKRTLKMRSRRCEKTITMGCRCSGYCSHGVVHPAARRPANKVIFAIISSLSPKAT